MRKKMIEKTMMLILVTFLFTACEYKYIEPEPVPSNVSFATDIAPIFNSCNISGCHSTGSVAPDLTGGVAYTSIISGGYVSTSDPQNSILYEEVIGPMSGYCSSADAAKILEWIKQGAQNN